MSYDHRTRRIDQIPDVVALDGSDEFLIWQAGRTRRGTLQSLIDKLPSVDQGGDTGGGTTPGYVLPKPTTTTLGGVLATAPQTNKFVRGIDPATGNLLFGEPASGTTSAVYAGTVDITKAPYNADPTGAVDATAAFNTAFADATVKAVFGIGTFKVLGQIDIPSSKALLGVRRLSKFIIPSTFSTSAVGVVKFQALEDGPMIQEWDFEFDQADVPFAQLKQYPPAIYARNSPRFVLDQVRIVRAWIGIDMQGNSGGAVLNGVEGSSFKQFCIIDGSFDTVKIHHMHFWPFGCVSTPNHLNAYVRFGNIGVEVGRCDDIKISESCFFACAKGVFCRLSVETQPAQYGCFGSITGTNFDASGGLYVDAGSLNCANCNFTTGPGLAPGVPDAGGLGPAVYLGESAKVRLTGGYVFTSVVAGPQKSAILSYGELNISGMTFENDVDHVLVNAANGNGAGVLTLTGCMFNMRTNLTRTLPLVQFNLNRGTFIGNEVSGPPGQGVFVSSITAGATTIDSNLCNGYDIVAHPRSIGYNNKSVKGGKVKRQSGIYNFADGQSSATITTNLFPNGGAPTNPAVIQLTMQSTQLGSFGPPWITLSGNNTFGINCPGSGVRSVLWTAECDYLDSP